MTILQTSKVRHHDGFTLVELLVTLALVGISAAVALPLATIVETRAKETELRRSLRTVRNALDEYKAAVDSGQIPTVAGASGYPPSLAALVTGVPRSTSLGSSSAPLVFLRTIPRDPFYDDKTTDAEQTWLTRAYGKQKGDHTPGDGVFDISSQSERRALDGTLYMDW